MTYSVRCTLRNKDVNLYRRMRTSALFELLQELSIAHTETLGMGRHMTLDRGFLWVVLQQKARIYRMPEYDETIVAETWPGRTMHVLFPRYYRILDEAGNILAEASAVWALMDQNARKLVFPDQHGIRIEEEQTGFETDLPLPFKRETAEHSRPYQVMFCDCDLNGHMNHTRYFDLAENILSGPAAGKTLKQVEAEYAAEVRCGETMDVSWTETENSAMIYGDTEKTCFRMKLEYEDSAGDAQH